MENIKTRFKERISIPEKEYFDGGPDTAQTFFVVIMIAFLLCIMGTIIFILFKI